MSILKLNHMILCQKLEIFIKVTGLFEYYLYMYMYMCGVCVCVYANIYIHMGGHSVHCVTLTPIVKGIS